MRVFDIETLICFIRKSNAGIAGVWMYKLGYGTTITEPNPDQIDTDPGEILYQIPSNNNT